MSLDLHATADQLERAALHLRDAWEARREEVARLAKSLEAADAHGLNQTVANTSPPPPYPCADCLERPGVHYAAPPLPEFFSVLATDGSHIDVDRHLPLRCYLLNIGVCRLDYSLEPDVLLTNTPYLAVRPEELRLSDPRDPDSTIALEGAVLGIKRTAEEALVLARWAGNLPKERPALTLLDGSLILSEVMGEVGQYRELVRTEFLQKGLLRALEALHQVSMRLPLAVASYVSLPGRRDVVNTLQVGAGQKQSHELDITDRDLFALLLATGERSALFGSTVSVVRDYYGSENAIRFFYLNVGEEIARVEVPAWVAEDELLLGLTHTLVLDQCRRGQGYPVALQEAHEQAVINGSDREEFRRMVEELLARQRLPVYTSEKQRSKRGRWV